MDSVKSQPISAPTEFSKAPEFTNGMNKAARDVAWYQAELSRVPQTARQIFKDYSGIPEEEILAHIYHVRDKAWDV